MKELENNENTSDYVANDLYGAVEHILYFIFNRKWEEVNNVPKHLQVH